MTELFIDIETLPADLSPAEIENLALDKVPGNYKKPEAIDKWVAENKDEIHRKTALDQYLGRTLCVGVAYGDSEPQTIIGDSDEETLRLLESYFSGIGETPDRVVSFYGEGFDFPWLWHRGIKYDLERVCKWIPSRKFSDHSFDIHNKWLGTDYRGSVKLDTILKFLGLPQKEGDGSQVYDWYQDLNFEKIIEYCNADVAALQQIYAKLAKIPGF